ncbi:MAG: tyrosine-type recombinase/integrase [Acidobacteriia bacterium]|nr:tyrosine-type recombinase/integrase [Terriglobia bacterium]
MVRKRFRYQNPTPKIISVGGVNKWYVQYRNAEGKKRSKTLGLESKMTASQLQAAVSAILAPINAGLTQTRTRSYTIENYVETVFIPVQRRGWKGSSAITAIQQIRFHLTSELGNRPLEKIQREELQLLLDRKAECLSQSVVGHLRWFLNAIFKLAVSEGIVPFNPAAELIVPKKCRPGRESQVLASEQVEAYFSALELRELVAARLALIEGMRPGEFLARKWPDMHPEVICIPTRVYRGEFDTPKNGKARESAMSDGTWRALLELRKTALDPNGFVFASEAGDTPISRDNLWRRYMKPALDKVGLGWATFQVLRRTNASLSHKAGVDPKVSADQRGHGLGVSMEHYTQSDSKQKREAVRKLESALIPKPRKRSA